MRTLPCAGILAYECEAMRGSFSPFFPRPYLTSPVTTPSRQPSALIAPGSIDTVLNYVKDVPGKAWTMYFTKPGAEKHFEDFNRYQTSHPTTVGNIRGREDDIRLFENGFE